MQLTRMQVHWGALLLSIGGWIVTLDTFAAGLTPQGIGGLLMILGGAMGTKAPEFVRNLPGPGPTALVTRTETVASHPAPGVEILEETKIVTKREDSTNDPNG